MTLPLLKLLGHEIAKSNWGENSKHTVWTAFIFAFFGSFRMGEILPQQEKSFSPRDTLLWGDKKFLEQNHILIHIKSPKSRLPQGEFVDIFSFSAPRHLSSSSSGGLERFTAQPESIITSLQLSEWHTPDKEGS